MVLLIQKEVAQRICDEKKPTLISWMVRLFAQPTLISTVPASAFHPPPKVQSAVLQLRCHQKPLLPEDRLQPFLDFLSRAYDQPRKTLLNNLASGSHQSKERVIELCEKAEVSPQWRPHQLNFEQWERLEAIFATGS